MLIPMLSLILSIAAPGSLTPLERAIWTVETNRCPSDCPKGDGGKAIGPLQIHRACFEDVRRPGEKYTDCKRLDFSVQVFRRYMKRYATKQRLGRVTDEAKARIWNGGPMGHRRFATKNYWAKVQRALNGEEQCQ